MPPRLLRVLLPGVALALALWDAARQAWVCDDAFISFRYAKNLVEGRGLVFNAGERVEGYTNFLWTLACALGMTLGLEPVRFSLGLGLLCFAGLLVLLLRGAGRGLPYAALGAAACLHLRLFATSGLETMAFAALCLAALERAAGAEGRGARVGAGALATLAALTRPEGLLVVGLVGLAGLWRRRTEALWVPALVIPAYLAWKVHYFGDLLPNTWYAKAGDGPQWARGAYYLRVVFGAYPALIAALPLGLWAARRAPGELRLWLHGAFAGAWILYTWRVGGDFMFARFLLPVFPSMLVLAERGLAELGRPGWALGLAFVGTLALGRPPDEVRSSTTHDAGAQGVVEERDWYPARWHREARRQGELLRPVFAGTDAKVIYLGTQAMLVYYAEIPTAIEGHVGLTDREIARLPARPSQDRMGHGRKVGLAYMQARGADLLLGFRLEIGVPELYRAKLPGGLTAQLITWREPLLRTLMARGVEATDLPAFVEQYLANIDGYAPDAVKRTFDKLEPYYFVPSRDMARRGRMLAWLAAHPAAEPPPAGP